MTDRPDGNLLRRETSPYLLQHADNPVHWRPWGPEALAVARETNRPVLLSVGYAACHWCHVMAHESFEDETTAAEMNRLFVNVKVDREERPEIDALYMSALHLMGEQGGWPLTMFLTPEGEPFWGGTYFPPEPRHGRPAFRQVLRAVSAAHAVDGEKVAANAAAVREGLVRLAAARPGPVPGTEALRAVSAGLLRAMDPEQGGLRGAPKFPNAPILRFLLVMARRLGEPVLAEAVHLTLRRMSQGGIHDHLGGGYARYSVDGEWLVPHFEKMLYDNAQLLELLALAQADRPDPLLAERARGLVGWLEREMLLPGGAFAATLDADSEGEEGRFYVWRAEEVEAVLALAGLSEDAALFRRVYDVPPGGNWEGTSVLNRRHHPEPLSETEETRLAACRAALLSARESRVRPGLDDKVLADWNGHAVLGLARAAAVFGEPGWLGLAREAFEFVVREMTPGGRLLHAWREGRGSAAGLLEDHAALSRAALALHEATGEAAFLDRALGWAEACETLFAAPGGGYHAAAADAGDVPFRLRSAADDAVPSGNGVLAEVQARLHHLMGEALWRERAERTVAAFGGRPEGLVASPSLLVAADLLERGGTAVVAGEAGESAARALAEAVLASPDPSLALLRSASGLPPGHPAAGKGPVGGRPAAYLCRGQRCGLPITELQALREVLAARPAA